MIVLIPGTTDEQRELLLESLTRYLSFIRRASGEVVSAANLRSDWGIQRIAALRLVVEFADLLKMAMSLPGRLAFRPAAAPHAYFNAVKVDARNLP